MSQPSETPPHVGVAPHDAFFTDAYLARRRQAMARYEGLTEVEDSCPTAPAGHARGIATSIRLTHQYRQTYREQSMDISPQDVVAVLTGAGIKNWVLMGLHGYVGYLPEPRATQDVDIMVPYSDRKRVVRAVCKAWPALQVREFPQVVRFLDPGDADSQGNPKPVLDLMLPWAEFQQTILADCVHVDAKTQHRIPTLEAALVSKYAAMLSPERDAAKRSYDAGDFRGMVRANHEAIDHDSLRRLAGQVWDGGAEEIERFVEIALSDDPFPF